MTDQSPDKDSENNADAWEEKADLWKPLNYLLEVANRNKSPKIFSQGLSSFFKSEPLNTPENDVIKRKNKAKSEIPNAPDGEAIMPETKTKERGQKWKVEDEKNGMALVPGPVKRRRLRAKEQKKEAVAGELFVSGQVVLDTVGVNCNRRNFPIWFSLVASDDQ